MARLTRDQMRALNILFDEFALHDQESYYQRTLEKYRKSASQVNRIRAFFAFLAGLAAALAGLTVQSVFASPVRCATPIAAENHLYCGAMGVLVIVASVLAVIAPALGGAFSTLADLYQWDRLITIYENARDTLKVADAYSPDDEMPDVEYRASLIAFAHGALNVMQDEAAQFGQLIRQPERIEQYIAAAQAHAAQAQLLPRPDKDD